MDALYRWWYRPDPFDWLSSYLELRNLTRPIQRVMTGVAATLTLVPIHVSLISEDRPGPAVTVLLWLVGVLGLVQAFQWSRRWPTAPQSLACALTGNAAVAIYALAEKNVTLSMLACTTLTISGGYFALFHSPRFTLYNFAVSAGVGTVVSARLSTTDGLVDASLALWLVLSLNAIGPVAVLALIHAFAVDLPEADRDPLTGLLNRRGLTTWVASRIVNANPTAYLRITVIDLDDFKRINDTYGHVVGDETLIAVADVLRECATSTAIVCRTGGEEFLVADMAISCEPPHYADLICGQIAGLPHRVTSSIGSARFEVGAVQINGSLVDDVIARADHAMYEAKRSGGNRVHHSALNSE